MVVCGRLVLNPVKANPRSSAARVTGGFITFIILFKTRVTKPNLEIRSNPSGSLLMARSKQTKRAVSRPVRAVTKKTVSPPPKQQFESESESEQESDNESNYSDEELQNDDEDQDQQLEKDFERLREKERLSEREKELEKEFESEREKQKKKERRNVASRARYAGTRRVWRLSPPSDNDGMKMRKLLRVPVRLCNSRLEFYSAAAKRVGNTGPLQLCIIGIIRIHFPLREEMFPGDGDADFVVCAYLPPDLVDALHNKDADVDAIFNEICRRIKNNEILRNQLWASPSKAIANSRGLTNANGWALAYVW